VAEVARTGAWDAAAAGVVAAVARLGRALRRRGVRVGPSDEADGLAALALVDVGDRDEVRLALRAALKIRPRDAAAFEELFAALGSAPPAGDEEEVVEEEQVPRRAWRPWVLPDAAGGRPRRERAVTPVTPTSAATAATAAKAATGEEEAPAGEEPGYSPQALLRRKPFADCTAADLAAMERLMDELARRLASRPSRRRVPARGAARGEADLRRSFRRAVAHGGEFLALARRRRAIERPRLVVLCDTSGSMDPHARFLLAFVMALRRVARRCELFAFNTALVRLTPWLRAARDAGGAAGPAGGAPSARSAGGAAGKAGAGLAPGVAEGARSPGRMGDIERMLGRLAAAVPDWSGGTRIGECLAEFVERWLDEAVDGRTVVLILSDGLDRGDVAPLARAMRAIHGRARRVLWLNPLAGDRRYEPTARAMAAALPWVDRLLPAHDLESLERLLPLLAA
jgi:uncharacterized protein with von Willebrand factor type A (vWA) domain